MNSSTIAPLEAEVRPMFSGFAVYFGEKILLMLRDSPKQPKDNRVWLVFSETANLADPGIRKDFPSIRLIKLLGGKIAHWRLIQADSATFESEALHVCVLLLKHYVRFGRVPQSRKTRPAKQCRKCFSATHAGNDDGNLRMLTQSPLSQEQVISFRPSHREIAFTA